MKYVNYRVADFATDEDFILWVQRPTEEADAFWDKFQQECHWQRKTVSEARELVLHLSQEFETAPEDELDELWDVIAKERQHYLTYGEQQSESDNNSNKFIFGSAPKFSMMWAAAAAAVLLLVSGFLLYQQRQTTITYATTAGERLHLRLPDSSLVVLNNNTKLIVSTDWSSDEDRIVQLQGQAFFSVTHKHNNQKFIVQTPDGLEVEVLGTEFSVSNKDDLRQVILESGKVNLSYKDEKGEQQLEMAPGELAEVTETNGILKHKVQPELYNAWKDSKLLLEDKTLKDVAKLLSHSYGYSVAITDPSLKTQRITAYLDNNTPDHILSTVSETLGVKVSRENKNITISSN